MSANFYDVVVLGTRLGGLLCGALLAKRGFRVLVVGQGDLEPTYRLAPYTLPRAPFAFHPAHSPVARRALSELALHQLFRRRATTMDPVMQVALPGHRLDIPLDDSELEREIEREFPEAKRPIDEFHKHVTRVGDDLDKLMERDLVWPPETLLERREMARATTHQPFDKRGEEPDPLAQLPEDHPFRVALSAPVRFTTGIDPDQVNSLAAFRLYGGWLRGAATLDGGYSWLRQTLIDKIHTYSGDVRPGAHAELIELKRQAVSGIRIAGSEEQIGCSFVVAACDVDTLVDLVPDRGVFEQMFDRVGAPQPNLYRYTLNVVLEARGVPAGMARDVFFIRDATRPLRGSNLLHVEAHPEDAHGRRLLCVETLLPRSSIEGSSSYLSEVREEVLSSLRELVPFMDRHLILADSPHDGRGGYDFVSGHLLTPSDPWYRGVRTMAALHHYPRRSALGVSALTTRTPIKRLLLCSNQVVPGLGLEGTILSATSAARIVTRSDRRKERMRRGLWTKVDI